MEIDRSDENAKLTDCYYDKKDWRACKDEVSPASHWSGPRTAKGWVLMLLQMARFKACWSAHQNDQRTETKDA
jgi:cytochrome c oxidase assembly factor 4